MSTTNLLERDKLHQQLGARNQRINELEQQLEDAERKWREDAMNWQRLERHRKDLAEWLIDQATNDSGRVTKSQIDAGLAGELFVPCSFTGFANEKCYRLELVSTDYSIREVTDA